METVLDIISWILLALGGAVAVLSGVGLLRFPDVYSRMHATSMLESLGAFCVLLGLFLQSGFTVVGAKLVILYVFLLLTAATSGHALAKSTYEAGVKPYERPGRRSEPQLGEGSNGQ